MHRVLIVEDDSAFRARYAAMLANDASFEVVASVATGGEGLAMLDLRKPDILLVDLGLPDVSGIEVIRHASQTLPKCECMVVTVFGDEEHVLASIEAGAAGYLLKDASEESFLSGIRELMNGGSPISPIIARQLLKRLQPPSPIPGEAPLEPLSEREMRVLDLLARGFSYAECASMLSVSSHTIGTFVKRIYRKLEVNSRAEAVFEASSRGILDAH